MSDINTTLGSAGAGELIEALGQRWHVMPPTLEVRAHYVARMKLQARKEAIATKRFLPPADYAAEAQRLDAAMNAGAYKWGGPVFADVVGSADGSNYLLALLLHDKHPEVTVELVEAIYADAPDATAWAFRAALWAADPKLFPPPATERPTGVRPATDLLASQPPASVEVMPEGSILKMKSPAP